MDPPWIDGPPFSEAEYLEWLNDQPERTTKMDTQEKGKVWSPNKLTDSDLAALEKLARQERMSDRTDFNPMEMSGSNFDDAYRMGVEDGEILHARLMCDLLGIKWTTPKEE